nr:hypothetical protein [Salmonella enterica]
MKKSHQRSMKLAVLPCMIAVALPSPDVLSANQQNAEKSTGRLSTCTGKGISPFGP